MKRTAFLLLAFAGLTAFAGCAEKNVTTQMNETFDKANMWFTKGKYSSSRDLYTRIIEEEPDSPFRIHVLLAEADTYFMGKEYDLSAPLYRRFRELYPLDPLTPRALFYEGMSYYWDIPNIARDQTSTKKALEIFQSFLKIYPHHFATPFAKQKVDFINDRLAEKTFLRAKFYYRIDAFGACIGRVDELLEKYPDTRFRAEALLYKGMSYLAEEAFGKSRAVFMEIIKEHPETKAAKKAQTELTNLNARFADGK